MVTISDYRVNVNSEGKSFCSLILQGELELVKSKTSRFYATARKTSITSTFDENTCRQLIGKTIKGSIVKVDCDEYDYIIPESGEVIRLNYNYSYVADSENVEEEVFQ
ncbi:MAG: hypothetical protein EBT39_05570 [Sphingobacteriia bacterium]|jgi:hypothetical protein|nr:hypothetical protein [Candidatus Fonsibacter lacus]